MNKEQKEIFHRAMRNLSDISDSANFRFSSCLNGLSPYQLQLEQEKLIKIKQIEEAFDLLFSGRVILSEGPIVRKVKANKKRKKKNKKFRRQHGEKEKDQKDN